MSCKCAAKKEPPMNSIRSHELVKNRDYIFLIPKNSDFQLFDFFIELETIHL